MIQKNCATSKKNLKKSSSLFILKNSLCSTNNEWTVKQLPDIHLETY